MKRLASRILIAVAITLMVGATATGREWVDASGHYRIDAELLVRNHSRVVLERNNKDKDLISVAIADLSEDDQRYLQTLEDQPKESDVEFRDFTMRNGDTVHAAAVEYAKRDITIRRQRGRPYINDKLYDNLPGIYRRMLPEIVSHFEGVKFENERDFTTWLRGLRGDSKSYTLEGVMLEFENGDLYGVPFFFFSDKDRDFLKNGWDDWLKASEDQEKQEQYSLNLRAQSATQQQNQENELIDRKIQLMQLAVQGYGAGLFDLWEVGLVPPGHIGDFPMVVVVPGRNSNQAIAAALSKYPGYQVAGVSKAIRRNQIIAR